MKGLRDVIHDILRRLWVEGHFFILYDLLVLHIMMKVAIDNLTENL